MSGELDAKELERRLLHALLFEHGGLTVEDVAHALEISRDRADALLDAELRAGLIDLRVEDQVYVSLRKLRTAETAILRADLARARDDARRKKRALFVALPAGIIVAGLAWYVATRPEPPPQAMTPSPPGAAAGFDERVEARLAGERRRQWEVDLADREQRLAKLDAEAAAADCVAKWKAGAACYVSHRNMTRADFDEDRALLASEIAKLRRMLEQSR